MFPLTTLQRKFFLALAYRATFIPEARMVTGA